MNLNSVEAWARWFAQQKSGMMRDIDGAWRAYGLDAYIGEPFHYWLVMAVCSLPFMLICSLLCCIGDEDDFDKPQYPQQPASPSKGEAAPASPKKRSAVRAEKLD